MADGVSSNRRSPKKIRPKKRKKHCLDKDVKLEKSKNQRKLESRKQKNKRWSVEGQNHSRTCSRNDLNSGLNFDYQVQSSLLHESQNQRPYFYENGGELDCNIFASLRQLENECYTLRSENERLKCALFNIRLHALDCDDNRPEVEIVFRNEDLAQHYRTEIECFLINLLSRGYNSTGVECGNSVDEMFTIDAAASENQCSDRVPLYETAAASVLGDERTESLPSSNTRMKCFNCSGNHYLSNCPETLDYQKIAQRKSEHYLITPQANSSRYHVQEKLFHTFKPGVISQDLRDALQLQPTQVPPYIYRMRVLGYPPGWLEEAAVKSSGLIMYGKEDADNQSNATEFGKSSGSAINYDFKKLIDFPGFNVPLSPDYIDESHELGYPPFQQSQLRAIMESSLKKSKGNSSKKRDLKSSELTTERKIQQVEDMDVDGNSEDEILILEENSDSEVSPPLPTNAPEEEIPPPPPTSPPPPPTTPPPPLPSSPPPPLPDCPEESLCPENENNTENCSVSCVNSSILESEPGSRDSPSLVELEATKKMLMLELCSTVAESGELLDSANSDECSTDLDIIQIPNAGVASSLTVSLGSPRLPTFSSCVKLPDYKKFSEGIQGQLYFENSSESTGGFERMKSILQKVRKKLNS